MKKIMLFFFSILLLTFATNAQEVQKIRYFDVTNKEISKSIFEEKRATNAVLDIPGDSSNHHKLINREEQGKINDRAKLISFLESASGKKINSLKQIVIIYYPGSDPCNSTGNIDFIISTYKEIEKGVNKIAKATTFYVYKDIKGLERYKNAIPWIKDSEQIVEKLFFKYHYPCSSFTVISKNGNYSSYFGEFYKDLVLETSKKLNR